MTNDERNSRQTAKSPAFFVIGNASLLRDSSLSHWHAWVPSPSENRSPNVPPFDRFTDQRIH